MHTYIECMRESLVQFFYNFKSDKDKGVFQNVRFSPKRFYPPSDCQGDGTNSFPIDLNTNILENTTPFLRIAATLVYGSYELVNSKFK